MGGPSVEGGVSTGKLWCAHLPTVRVRPAPTPKALTLVLPYYENPGFLRQHLGWWATFPAHLRAQLSVIVVDDGSPDAPAESVLAEASIPIALRLFRVDVDVRWNWLAARNIGAHHAPEGWLLLTDMDHVCPQTTAEALVSGAHDPGTIYGFSRIESTGTPIAPHPNSWFLTREMFWTAGGYDETLSGYYGTDGEWRRRLAHTAPMAILEDRLIRHEFEGDASTRRYARKQPEDAMVRRLIAARRPGWFPRTLLFPYRERELRVHA